MGSGSTVTLRSVDARGPAALRRPRSNVASKSFGPSASTQRSVRLATTAPGGRPRIRGPTTGTAGHTARVASHSAEASGAPSGGVGTGSLLAALRARPRSRGIFEGVALRAACARSGPTRVAARAGRAVTLACGYDCTGADTRGPDARRLIACGASVSGARIGTSFRPPLSSTSGAVAQPVG